jgi:hypothetical protein
VWIDNKKTRGYKRTAFEEAFERYLPPLKTGSGKFLSHIPIIHPKKPGRTVGDEELRGFQAEIEPVGPVGPTTLKSAENPSETANPTDLPGQNGANGRVAKENFAEPQFSSVSSSQDSPNGLDTSSSGTPRSEVERKILDLRHEHPDWSFRKIGRECAVTHKRVQRVISQAEGGVQ